MSSYAGDESTDESPLEKIMTYVKTPYFAVLCIMLVIFILYWFRDSFTTKKPKKKTDELDDLIKSIHTKQEKLRKKNKDDGSADDDTPAE